MIIDGIDEDVASYKCVAFRPNDYEITSIFLYIMGNVRDISIFL